MADVPDESKIPNLFTPRGATFNGRQDSVARFQSSAIPVANETAAEIINFECRQPGRNGSVASRESVNKIGEILQEAKGKTGADLKNHLQTAANSTATPTDAKWLINVTDKPEEIYRNFPATGCEINSTVNTPDVSFTDIFTDTEGFISDVAVNTITYLPNRLYEMTAPYALRYAFFTPHAERGETLFDVYKNGGETAWRGANNEQLGFNKQSISQPEKIDQAMWIKAALWIRWLLSGFFVLIIVGVGFVYMFNRTAEKQRAVLRILPRLLLATVLMLVIGPLMGWGISTSNLVTRALFDVPLSTSLVCKSNGQGTAAGASADAKSGGCGLLTQLNSKIETFIDEDAAAREGTGVDGQSAGNVLIGTLTLIAGAIFFSMLLLVAVGRQILLLLLVAVSPAACFALVFEKTRQWATRWMQAFAIVCLAPAGMALALYFGLSLAGMAWGSAPILWFALMVITFFAVWKIPLMLKNWIGGGVRGPSGSTTALRMASNGLNMIPGAGLLGTGASMLGTMSGRADQAALGNFSALRPGLPSGRGRRGLGIGGGGGLSGGRGGGGLEGGIGPAYGGGVRTQTAVEKDEERRHARVLADAVGESVAEAMRRGDTGQVNISNPDEVNISNPNGTRSRAPGGAAIAAGNVAGGVPAAGGAVGGGPSGDAGGTTSAQAASQDARRQLYNQPYGGNAPGLAHGGVPPAAAAKMAARREREARAAQDADGAFSGRSGSAREDAGGGGAPSGTTSQTAARAKASHREATQPVGGGTGGAATVTPAPTPAPAPKQAVGPPPKNAGGDRLT